jgi:hypothetical protein
MLVEPRIGIDQSIRLPDSTGSNEDLNDIPQMPFFTVGQYQKI